MARLWFFNPWNDLALGSDSRFYTPPPAAIQLTQSGASVPLWMASPQDYVILSPELKSFYAKFNGHYKWPKLWDGQPIEECVPWGWSKAVRQIFIDAGINHLILPSDNQLECWRQLSHRRLTCLIHNELQTGIDPIECFNPQECLDALRHWEKVIGKYPWSSSGRGIFSGSLNYIQSFITRCKGSIAHQNSVLIEPAHDVVIDFSMLFFTRNKGKTLFQGFSLFENNKRAYVGNILISQSQILELLSNYISENIIEDIKIKLIEIINDKITPYYEGPIGIDMFIHRASDSSYHLNPCVEVNLRYTMGFLALSLQQNHLPGNFQGYFQISSEHQDAKSYLDLNPPNSQFHFFVSKSDKFQFPN